MRYDFPMQIGIVGPGRLGRSLAHLWAQAGHSVQVFGRNVLPTGEVLVLTVPDAQLNAVAQGIPPGPVVLHCSGAKDLRVLAPHTRIGSFHPLMSFPGPEVHLPTLKGVPAAISGTPEAKAIAEKLANDLEMIPVEVPGDRRLYHAAAVMAGNFATVLLADAAEVLAHTGVSYEQALRMLLPLAQASLANAVEGPAKALTGPVVRGDQATLDAHREALREAGLLEHAHLYDQLTARAEKLLKSERTPPSSQS